MAEDRYALQMQDITVEFPEFWQMIMSASIAKKGKYWVYWEKMVLEKQH